MMPIAPLMIEHRLMDRMIALIKSESAGMRVRPVNTDFIETVVDFFSTYVGQFHHGKEEDILFKRMGGKVISHELRDIMKELLEDHITGKRIIERLARAKDRIVRGDDSSAKDILKEMKEMLALYPPHIEKEDSRFFPSAMKYFSTEEQALMLDEMDKFDESRDRSDYTRLVQRFEQENREGSRTP